MSAEEQASGTRLGRYVLDGWLASGGMSDVYRARAYGVAGVVKELVIKRVAAGSLGSEHALERFVEEARLSMQLSHANIGSVFDFGRADDGYYLAMEWVDGIDLAALIGRATDPSPLPPYVTAFIGAEIARALQHAHDHGASGGIVHRDVKPSNVLVSRAGEVKLGDFGIAITLGDDRTVAGTRGYIAPEQARGEPVDARADIFGLGKVLLEIAVGFRVEDEDVAHQLTTIDIELASTVSQMLAADPEMRPRSARSAGGDLERLVARSVARGDEPPRDVLVRLVARECAAQPVRLPPSPPRLATMESFAITATARDPSGQQEVATRNERRLHLQAERGAARSTSRVRVGAPTKSQASRGLVAAGLIAVLGAPAVMYALRVHGSPTAPHALAVSRREAVPRVPSPQPIGEAAPAPVSEVPATTHPASDQRAMPADAAALANARSTPSTPHHDGLQATTARSQNPRSPSEPPTRPPSSSGTPAPTPEPDGSLSVAARPWATVFIDGRRAGTTPLIGVALSAGSHQLRLENEPLGVVRAMTVVVPAGGRRNVSVTLD